MLWQGSQAYKEQETVAALRPLAASAAAAACVASITAGTDNALLPTTALQPFTSLERLWGWNRRNLKGDLHPLWSLTSLRQLNVSGFEVYGNWGGVSRLTALSRLELDLLFDGGQAVVGALAALRGLTSLCLRLPGDMMQNTPSIGWKWRHLGALPLLEELTLWDFYPEEELVAAQLPALAPRLRALELSCEDTAAMLPAVSTCTGLTRLQLKYGGGQDEAPELQAQCLSQLAPLAPRLQHFQLWALNLSPPAVPNIVATLSGLTHLVRPSPAKPPGGCMLLLSQPLPQPPRCRCPCHHVCSPEMRAHNFLACRTSIISSAPLAGSGCAACR